MKPGDLLNNNAIVIDSHRIGEEFIVLALRPHPLHPYVVWNADYTGEAYRGDYCVNLNEAMNCFASRAGVHHAV